MRGLGLALSGKCLSDYWRNSTDSWKTAQEGVADPFRFRGVSRVERGIVERVGDSFLPNELININIDVVTLRDALDDPSLFGYRFWKQGEGDQPMEVHPCSHFFLSRNFYTYESLRIISRGDRKGRSKNVKWKNERRRFCKREREGKGLDDWQVCGSSQRSTGKWNGSATDRWNTLTIDSEVVDW